jgi:hypothetical protein
MIDSDLEVHMGLPGKHYDGPRVKADKLDGVWVRRRGRCIEIAMNRATKRWIGSTYAADQFPSGIMPLEYAGELYFVDLLTFKIVTEDGFNLEISAEV